MTRRPPLLLMLPLLTALTTSACDKKEQPPVAEPPAAPIVEADVDEEPPRGGAADEEPAAAPPDRTVASEAPEKARALRATFREALREGRKLVQAKKYDEGLKRFEEARKIDPNNARILSEIGWAAFLAGDLDRAERANADSVRFAQDDNVKGASLYNLGRVAEQREQLDLAARHYERSLAVRDNKIVAKRLAALKAKGASAAAVRAIELEPCRLVAVPGETLEDVCERLTSGVKVEQGACAPDDMKQKEAEGGALTRVGLFSYRDLEEWTDYHVIALRYRDAWYAANVAWVYNPGAFGIFEDLDAIDFDLQQLAPGGDPEVLVTLTHTRHDTDMGIDEEEDEATEVSIVYGVVEDHPTQLMRVPTSYTYRRDRMGIAEDDEIASDLQTKGLPINVKKGAALNFDRDAGKVTVSAIEGREPTVTPGTYPLGHAKIRCVTQR